MFIVVAGALMAGSLACAAQDKGYWRAASTETVKMTGDIAIADLKVTINFVTFPLAPIRRLKPVEVSAVFDADVNAGISGDLYRLRVPANKYIVRQQHAVRRRGHAVDGDLRHGAHAARWRFSQATTCRCSRSTRFRSRRRCAGRLCTGSR